MGRIENKVDELQLELLQELQEELSDGILNEDSTIQVLEENNIIIDWYYNDEEMARINKIDEDDTEEDIETKQTILDQYNQNKPYLEEWIVRDVVFFIEKYFMGNYTIKELRQMLGLEQRDLSNLLLIPIGTIRNWEQGRRKIPIYVERLIIRELSTLLLKKQNIKIDN